MRLRLASHGLDIWIEKRKSWIYAEWKGPHTADSLRDGCEMLLALMVSESIFDVLNDNTKLQGISPGAAPWLANDWFPRMYGAGLRLFAWVPSPRHESRVSADATLAFMDGDQHGIRTFDDVDAAKEWLHPGAPERLALPARPPWEALLAGLELSPPATSISSGR